MKKTKSNIFKILFLVLITSISMYFNYFLKIEVKLYSHVFYIVLILTAFWFYEKIILTAVLLVIVHFIFEIYFGANILDPVVRSSILMIVAVFLYYQRKKTVLDEKKIRLNLEKDKRILYRNSILFEVSARSYSSLKEELNFVLEKMLAMTESSCGFLFLYDETNGSFNVHLWAKCVEQKGELLKISILERLEMSGYLGKVIEKRQPIIKNDFGIEIEYQNGEEKEFIRISRFMAVPILADDKIVAVVGLSNKEKEFDSNDAYQVAALMGGVWNAAERHESERMLEIERNKYLSTILSIGDAVIVCDRMGNIEMINAIACRMTGWEAEDAMGRHYSKVLVLRHENKGERIADPIEEVFRTDTVHELSNHAMLVSKDGTCVYLEDSAAPIRDNFGKTIGAVLVFRDVTEKREQRKKIEYLSYHDALTGLYNRRFFEEEIRRLDTKRSLPLTVLMGDLNGLKLVNDAFGHNAGDEYIVGAAKLIREYCRQEDIIARWGGDEFAVLLPKTSSEETAGIVERINAAALKINNEKGALSIAFGWSTKTDAPQEMQDIFREAEGYMYRKKFIDNQSLRGETIKTIMHTLFEKCPWEKAHAERVGKQAVRLAQAMHLSAREVNDIGNLGMMHDIGKIIVANDILEKPGKLDEAEFREMIKHSETGYRILASSAEVGHLAEGVLYHHEKWDGSGYAKGEKGSNIPLQSRVISIVDAYDTMTSDCPYRKKMDTEEAVLEIFRNAGKQFDPDLARVFVTKVLNKEWVE